MLHISQSAISEQMRNLEDEVGTALFDRSERQTRLTAQGEIFLTGARATLQSADRTLRAVRQSVRGEVGMLTIGFFVGGNGSFFPSLIRSFRQKFREVKVSLIEMAPAPQLSALQTGELDVAFTRPLPATAHEHLRSEHFYTERLYAVLPKGHPLEHCQEISLRELAEEHFVMSDRKTSPAVFDRIISLCTESGFSPHIDATASVNAGVLALVEAGEGVSVVAEGSRFLGSDAVTFVPLVGAGASVDLVLAWSPEHISGVTRSFLAAARDYKAGLRL